MKLQKEIVLHIITFPPYYYEIHLLVQESMKKILSDAISYKIEFLESEFVKDFITRTTNETFKINKEQIN